jgi:hypothetical protein
MTQTSPMVVLSTWLKGSSRVPAPMREFCGHAVGADAHAVAELDLAFEHAVDVDLDVAPDRERAAHVDARRVDQGDALFHQAAGDVALVDALEFGELQSCC